LQQIKGIRRYDTTDVNNELLKFVCCQIKLKIAQNLQRNIFIMSPKCFKILSQRGNEIEKLKLNRNMSRKN